MNVFFFLLTLQYAAKKMSVRYITYIKHKQDLAFTRRPIETVAILVFFIPGERRGVNLCHVYSKKKNLSVWQPLELIVHLLN